MMAGLVATFFAAASVAPLAPSSTRLERVNATFSGLQQYFFDATGSFWKACGQNGGLGDAATNFECVCEKPGPYCKNCYRWWMAVTMQSLVSLNRAVPGHASLDRTHSLIHSMRKRSPYTSRAAPSWAYIDDYVWYVLMWMDTYDWLGESGDLNEAATTLELMAQWGEDLTCGGITWMYPDVDPRKNAITTLEVVQASAQLGVALAKSAPKRAAQHRARALKLWHFFESVHLLGSDPTLVHDNVTGTAHGLFHCCNGTVAPLCEPRGTLTWSYNQGMLLGAAADLHALTNDTSFLKIGAAVLDAVVTHLTTSTSTSDGNATVLREPSSVSLTIDIQQCDSSHDPSSSAGGDLFSFKGVFMQQLPRFLAAAKATLTPEQLAAARKLVADSADAAWAARVQPPFPESDVCNEFRKSPPPSGSPPKFTWDFEPLPDGGALTCMDARTQAQALSLFVADVRMEQLFGPRE